MEREENFQKVHPLHTLEGKHSELWHNIFVWCFDTLQHHLDLEHTLFLCNDKVTRMSAYWRCFTVRMDMLVIVIILASFSCIPEGSRESLCLG